MANSITNSAPSADEQPPRFQFRIVHVLYFFTALAASLATFGLVGLMLAALIIGFWATVFINWSRTWTFRVRVLVLCISCVFCCLFPIGNSFRPWVRRQHCMTHAKNIGFAMHSYHDTFGTFPPAFVPDDQGKPMHSWRVLLLPFLNYRAIYDRYDFGEPWDGPNNRKLLAEMPIEYRCPSACGGREDQGSLTSYVAVVGPRTAWPGSFGRTQDEFSQADGMHTTLLILEVGGAQIPWLEPRDLTFDEATEILGALELDAAAGHCDESFFYQFSQGRHVLAVDGSVTFVPHGLASERWAEALVFDDGVFWFDALAYYDGSAGAERFPSGGITSLVRPRLDNWLRLTLFTLIVVFPLPWVWIGKHGRGIPQ